MPELAARPAGPGGAAGVSNSTTSGGAGSGGGANSLGGGGGGGGAAGVTGGAGGKGGDGTILNSGGAGGAGAATPGAVGAVGTVGAVGGGGGGGGGGAHGFVGGLFPGAGATGGVGGAGGAAPGAGGGGGGGAGGYGAVTTLGGPLGPLIVGVTGGAGGVGGASVGAGGGSAGDGGIGLLFTGGVAQTFIIGAAITGGVGGVGGAGIVGGTGGDGGIGLVVAGAGGTTITVGAGIIGGIGGLGGLGGSLGANGTSGAGIAGQNLTITMGLAGLVTGGLGADAITFTGGANALTFANATTGLIGNISVTGGLAFDQSIIDTTVGNIISGSGSIAKTGAATVNLTGANTYAGTTTVTAGQLRASSANALGDSTGALIVDGGILDIDVAQSKGTLSGIGGAINLDANLAVTQSLDQTYAGAFIGAAGFTKNGAAGLTLTGNSDSYTGNTTVAAGRLLVSNTVGTFGSSTSLVSVNAGATLGGTGVIGGDVAVGNSGILAAGAAPGTLTINGNLLLNAASISNFELGDAGVAGGALNDLVDVNGQLTLDGTINLTPMESGYYQLFQYGTLINNGATVSSTLGTGTLQLGILNQVNVFVSNGGQLVQVWDGLDGVGNGIASGGAGTWNSANTNWTAGPDYSINDGWQSQVGVFGGAAGPIIVAGTQNFEGLQFVADGYQFTGGVLNMLGDAPGGRPALSFVNVNSGLTVGIGSVISGDAPNIGLYKIGGGTFVLSGANSYTGGTVISAGTLAIASDANLGAASGGLTLDGGTLHTTADIGTSRSLTLASTGRLLTDAGTALTLTGPLSGAGSLDKDGSGDLIFAGAASYTGGTVISAGTLQIGNGGTSGSLAGNVANAGVLAFDRSDAAIFAGVVSGAGSLEQRGSGTTVLTGTNVYTGGTVISAGTLQIGNGGTSGSIVGNVANAGVLAFDRSDAAIFAGAVSGAGSLEQRGSGTTVLTGTNTYTGGTIISAGTLQIGDGATSGSIVGNVADAGVLAFNRSDATIFAGAVSGAVSLEQRGSGTTVLTGTNTYTGGTIISAGTLQIGDGATSGSIVGNVADAGVLAFNRSDATIFAGAVSGTGSLEQRGSAAQPC